MTNGLRSAQTWALVLVLSGIAGPAAARQATPQPAAPAVNPTPSPANPAQAPSPQTTVPSALGPTEAPPIDNYVVGQAKPPATPGKAVLDMTLDQAMQRALDKNLNLIAARYNPQATDYQLLAARAIFTPTITSTYSYQSAERLNNNNLENAGNIQNQTQQYNAGVSMPLPWYGSNLSANFTNSRQFSNSTQLILNPSFSSGLNLQFTQPILQGFSLDTNRNTIRTLQIQRQISDTQLVATIENTKASVRTAYWNLKKAIEQIEIEQRSLDLANQLLKDNRTKVEIGTLAPIDTVQNDSSVATAEQALLNAQIGWQNGEIALDELLASGPDDDIYKSTINPTEQPVLAAESVDIAGAVKTALAQRTDLVEARQNLTVSGMNLDLNKQLMKPTLNLVAQYAAAGQGGTAISQGEAIAGGGGYSGALSQVVQFQVPTWSTAFNFTYPLGMAAAKANFARAQIGIDQAQAQLKATELQVSSTVTAAGLNVQNSYLQYQAAKTAAEAQQRTTQAEETRYQVGTSTNYNVVQQQDALTSARLTELQQLIAYLEAVAQFDLVQKVGNQ
jgi:outer membrane protein TolC